MSSNVVEFRNVQTVWGSPFDQKFWFALVNGTAFSSVSGREETLRAIYIQILKNFLSGIFFLFDFCPENSGIFG